MYHESLQFRTTITLHIVGEKISPGTFEWKLHEDYEDRLEVLTLFVLFFTAV